MLVDVGNGFSSLSLARQAEQRSEKLQYSCFFWKPMAMLTKIFPFHGRVTITTTLPKTIFDDIFEKWPLFFLNIIVGTNKECYRFFALKHQANNETKKDSEKNRHEM
jgi:hypothetical protein